MNPYAIPPLITMVLIALMGIFVYQRNKTSQKVVYNHGGSIDVKSEEGNGAEFIVRLQKHL